MSSRNRLERSLRAALERGRGRASRPGVMGRRWHLAAGAWTAREEPPADPERLHGGTRGPSVRARDLTRCEQS